jgi:hypothetical protein
LFTGDDFVPVNKRRSGEILGEKSRFSARTGWWEIFLENYKR